MINDYIKLSSSTPVNETTQQEIYKHYLTSKIRNKVQFSRVTESTSATQSNLSTSQGFLPRKSSPATDRSLNLNDDQEINVRPQRNLHADNQLKFINTSVSTINNDKEKSICILNDGELTDTKEN